MNPTSNTANALQQAGTSLANSTRAKSRVGDDTLGKDDFLKLLMAQVTHQDPLNPMDSAGMMNQLTQMGSLEQMININSGIDKLNAIQGDIARSNAYTFLDKDVSVRGGNASVSRGLPSTPVIFTLPREAAEVNVSVIDEDGHLVRRLEMGQYAAGNHEIAWDGKNDTGIGVADGRYRYIVSAKSENSDTIPVELFARGKVSAVRFVDGRSLIKVNGREMDIRDIVELSNRSEKLFAERKPLPMQQNFIPKPLLEEPRE